MRSWLRLLLWAVILVFVSKLISDLPHEHAGRQIVETVWDDPTTTTTPRSFDGFGVTVVDETLGSEIQPVDQPPGVPGLPLLLVLLAPISVLVALVLRPQGSFLNFH